MRTFVNPGSGSESRSWPMLSSRRWFKQQDLEGPERGMKSYDYERQTRCSVGIKLISPIPELEADYQSYLWRTASTGSFSRMFQLQKRAFEV